HPAQTEITTEEPLIGNPRQRVVLAGNLAPLLCFDHLVHAVLPCAIRHHASRELVYDLHLALSHNVLDIAPEQMDCSQRLPDQLFASSPDCPQSAHSSSEFCYLELAVLAEAHALLTGHDRKIPIRDKPAGERKRRGIHCHVVVS